MTTVTNELVKSLRICDTTSILNMYDTSFAHINKKNYRDFTREEIETYCHEFNQIVDKYGMPNLLKLTFTKDSTNGANIAILPLVEERDSTLNLKKSTLYIMFYPNQFFSDNKLLRFGVFTEQLYKKVPPPIEQVAPPNTKQYN